MNKTLLLIICDFLLLSLLALARFDTPEEETQDEVMPEDPIQVQGEIIDVLKLSLELEQESNESMSASLQETQVALDENKTTLKDTQTELSNRDAELAQEKLDREQLAKDKSKLTAEQLALQEDLKQRIAVLETTQNEVVDLSELTREQERAAIEQQRRMDQMQKELQEKLNTIAAAELREEKLQAEKIQTERANQLLNSKLQVAETETRLVRENLVATKDRADQVQSENKRLQEHATHLATQLTEGVAAQSEKLNEIAQEVRDSQPVSPNVIFTNFIDSGVSIDVRFHKAGRVTDEDFIRSIRPVVVETGGSLKAIFTWDDLHLTESNLRSKLLNFRGDIRIGRYTFSLTEMELLSVDPRIITVPLKEEWREFIKEDSFSLPSDPLKFDEVVLIDREEGDYGSIKFFKDMNTPGYFRLDSRFVNRMGGEVRPESSNALFTLSGEFIAVMVNREYAVHVDNFLPAKTITIGSEKTLEQLRNAHTRIRGQVERMPEDVR